MRTPDGEDLRAWLGGPSGAEPLLLITGGSSAGRAWRFLLPDWWDLAPCEAEVASPVSLASTLRVAVYDQRGTGGSSGSVPPDSASLASEHALAVGRQLLGGRFHVFGHSLGGMAALALAVAYPEAVASLILMGTTAGGVGLTMPDQDFLDNITGAGATDERVRAEENLSLSFGPSFRSDPRLFDDFVTEILAAPASPDSWVAQAMTFASHDVTEQLDGIGVPVLVVCGGGDRVMPLPNSQYLAEHIPAARLVQFAGRGHALDIEEAGEIVALLSGHLAEYPMARQA